MESRDIGSYKSGGILRLTVYSGLCERRENAMLSLGFFVELSFSWNDIDLLYQSWTNSMLWMRLYIIVCEKECLNGLVKIRKN